jgi:hypothetical protein
MNDYVELDVKGGYKTKVDPCIAKKISGRKLSIRSKKSSPYIRLWKDKKSIYLHRFILNAKKGEIVDHINGDAFDNRRKNLRICDYSINNVNHFYKSKNKTGFFGIYYQNNTKKYRVQVNCRNVTYDIAYYHNKIIAAIFRDIAHIKYHGIRAGLNFTEEIEQKDIKGFLEKTNGRIFKVFFVKRTDGQIREMLCRSGVHLDTTGEGLKFEPTCKKLFCVWNILKREHKFISMENVLCLIFKKTGFMVSRKRMNS